MQVPFYVVGRSLPPSAAHMLLILDIYIARQCLAQEIPCRKCARRDTWTFTAESSAGGPAVSSPYRTAFYTILRAPGTWTSMRMHGGLTDVHTNIHVHTYTTQAPSPLSWA